MIKKSIYKLLSLFGYKITKKFHKDNIMDEDKNFLKVYNLCKDYTMTSKKRMYALYKAVLFVIDSKIPGDFVECGVYRGGSVMLIAYTLLELNVTNRKVYLYDTFKGMPQPLKNDYKISNKKISSMNEWNKGRKESYNEWCYSPLTEVKNNLNKTKYPEKNLVFVEGKVEETIPKKSPSKTALLRLDTDFYESTKHELVHLFPRLSEKGVLIIDDYGCWAGVKKVVDEYFHNKPILFHRIDNTGIIGMKNF